MVQKLEERPPYVRFEVRADEDRAASLEAGHYVGKDVDYVLITPIGSKDCIERVATEWFDKLKQDVAEGRFKREWFNDYKGAYEEWKAGREIPLSGTPIANFSPASPAQVKTLQSLKVLTVEDLATANEEVLNRIGMGSRALKQRAIDWLASSADAGKLSAEMEKVRADNENMLAENKKLQEQVAALMQQVSALGGQSQGKKL